jgi:IS1 family transposase
MNKLTDEKRAGIIRALREGNSVRATARLTDSAKATVLKLLVELGEFCSIYQDHALTNLKTSRIEADEIWSFVGAKQKNATKEGRRDLWTYTAIDADSRLMISWLVGPRNHDSTFAFMVDVAGRLAKRAHEGPKVQLTTDGLSWYVAAVEAAFGYQGVDFAQIIETYGTPEDESGSRRYSPMVYTGVEKVPVFGAPDMDLVSTSYVEWANLSIRMGSRRFTRLTNGFSKKAENHAHAFSLFAMHYNYCRPHMTLTKNANGIKTTPAMASGLTDRVWTTQDILDRMQPDRLLHSN